MFYNQCVVSHFSCVQLFVTLWAIACQVPPWDSSARILEWVAMLASGDLPDPGIDPVSLLSPELADRCFTTSASWEAPYNQY